MSINKTAATTMQTNEPDAGLSAAASDAHMKAASTYSGSFDHDITLCAASPAATAAITEMVTGLRSHAREAMLAAGVVVSAGMFGGIADVATSGGVAAMAVAAASILGGGTSKTR